MYKKILIFANSKTLKKIINKGLTIKNKIKKIIKKVHSNPNIYLTLMMILTQKIFEFIYIFI